MKKKRKICLLIIAVIVVVGIVIAGVIIATNNNQDKKTIKAVENQLQTLLEQSDEVAASAPDDNANNIGEFVYSKMTYEVLEATESSCKIRVNAPSLYKVFHKIYDPDNIDTATDIEGYNAVVEKILEQIYQSLTDGEYEMVSADVVVPLDSEGKIKMTRELVDAMYGGFLTFQDELAEQYIQGLKDAGDKPIGTK